MRFRSKKRALRTLSIMLPAYARTLFKPAPLWTHLYVTRLCNMRCQYRFVVKEESNDRTEEELRAIIDKLHALGVRLLAFFGGEPTLREDLVRLIRYAHRRRMVTHLSTNGLRLHPEYVTELAEAGLDFVNLSVDSLTDTRASKKTVSREKGVLRTLLDARERYGMELTANLVISNKNIDQVTATLQAMAESDVPTSMGFIVRDLAPDAKQDEALFFHSEEEQQRLFDVLDEVAEMRAAGYNIIEPVQYFRDIKKFVRGDLDWKCFAGKDSIAVDVDGAVRFCGLAPSSEEFTIFELDRFDHKQLMQMRDEKLGDCEKDCLSNCRYTSLYYTQHPWEIVREVIGLGRRRSAAPA